MENYLLRELGLDARTTCTIDEAVGMMLGMIKGASWHYDIENYNELYYKFEGEIPSEVDFHLSQELEYERSALQREYYDAKKNKESKSVLEEKLNAIKYFDDTQMKLAKIYLCMIDDEFLKGTNSELRFDEDKQINLASLDKWWEKQKTNDSIQPSIFKDMQFKEPKPRKVDDYSTTEINTNVTLGLALRSLIEQSPTKRYGTIDDPTIDPLAKDLSKNLTNTTGQSVRSITDRIDRAFRELNDHLNK